MTTRGGAGGLCWPAVLAAVALFIAGGMSYRASATRLNGVGDSVPLPRGTLASIPLEVGEWRGEDVPLDEEIVTRTDTDDHINRVYLRHGGQEGVAVFVAYGVRMRDLMPHRPEVCYPGAGWVPDGTLHANPTDKRGADLPCQIHHFRRGGFDGRSVTVLNYYIVDGQRHADVAVLRALGAKGPSGARYVARVQVTSLKEFTRSAAEELVRGFAEEFAPVVEENIERAVSQAAAHAG